MLERHYFLLWSPHELGRSLNGFIIGSLQAMSSHQRYEPAFILSLIGGLLTLVGSAVVMMWAFNGTPVWSGAMGNMMGSYGGMMSGMGFSGTNFFAGMAIFGVLAGILVLAGAFLLYSRPEHASTWGAMILTFSILGLSGMGGFFIGAIVGIIGGILALTWRPVPATSVPLQQGPGRTS
jgi:hypothetical protein